jgi:hypothetical protein
MLFHHDDMSGFKSICWKDHGARAKTWSCRIWNSCVVAVARKDDDSPTTHYAYMVVHSSGDVRLRTTCASGCLWVCSQRIWWRRCYTIHCASMVLLAVAMSTLKPCAQRMCVWWSMLGNSVIGFMLLRVADHFSGFFLFDFLLWLCTALMSRLVFNIMML